MPKTQREDSKTISRFHAMAKWDGIVEIFCDGSNTAPDRIRLSKWANNLVPYASVEMQLFDKKLQHTIRQYFQHILVQLLRSPSPDFFEYRAAVMIQDQLAPRTSRQVGGLKPLDQGTEFRYYEVMFKYVKFMILAACPYWESRTRNRHAEFNKFGDIMLNGPIKQQTQVFNEHMQAVLNSPDYDKLDLGFAQQHIYPAIRTYLDSKRLLPPYVFSRIFKQPESIRERTKG
ncbi:hypothetical protein MBANPS3_008292 [Mucor bainieri]